MEFARSHSTCSIEHGFAESRSSSVFMLGVRRILPASIQYAADSAAGSTGTHHIVAAKNQWSRIVLKFQDLTPDLWCEFSFDIDWHPNEEARTVHDFASVGFTFMTEDGSNIEFAHVPGLARAQIDPYNDYIAGPAFHDRNASPSGTIRVRCHFLLPAPARQVAVAIRSWRNSHPFQVGNPALRQFVQASSPGALATEQRLVPSQAELDAALRVKHTWRILRPEPSWFHYSLVPDRRLLVRGQVVLKEARKNGALVRVVFKNAEGQELPPPYPDILMAPAIGAFINIPTHTQARRFTLELMPPPQAATVDLGFQTLDDDGTTELVAPLEVSLDDDLLLETISGDDLPDAGNFAKRVAQQLNSSPSDLIPALLDRKALTSLLTIQGRLRDLQLGERASHDLAQLRLSGFPGWALPEEPTWAEDPFRSPAWRLEFQSLSWLVDAAGDQNPVFSARAIDLALAWSEANPWGQPADVLSAHPMALAVRAEVFIQLLAAASDPKRKTSPDRILALAGEVLRHGFALSEIVSQNIFSFSLYQLHTAGSLLSLAKALPRFPLAAYWTSIALARLREGFDELIGPDGSLHESSQHGRLEIVSLGLILCHALEGMEEALSLRQRLLPRLREAILPIIALIDPAGTLPAFGETPHNCHHASWIRKLTAQYGRDWSKDPRIRHELSYPRGSRVFAFPNSGVIAARRYERGQDWGYFGTTLSAQHYATGHYDTTSFVFSARGERWVTDPGGFSQHETGAARHYLISSRAHNVAVPDGREQTAGMSWLRSTTSVEGANIIEVASNVHGPDYVHRRIFVVLNDLNALAVFDHFTASGRAVSFEAFLHFDPKVIAAMVNPQLILGYRGQKRLRIIPRAVSGRLSGLDLTQGRSDRLLSFQGFVSRQPGSLEPASVLRYAFNGQQVVCGGVMMAVDEASLKALSSITETTAVSDLLNVPQEETPQG